MGKGTKKKTVWRTFSFENGNCNENDASPADQNDNVVSILGQENNNTLTSNGKLVSNWRYRRYHSNGNGNENLSSENESSHDDDLQKSKELDVEEMNNSNTGYHGYRHQYHHHHHHHYSRPYFKRWPSSDQQYARNGFRKYPNENGNSGIENNNDTQSESNDNINQEDDSNRIQSNHHHSRSNRIPFHRNFNGGYRRWENRYYHPNSSIGNYNNRGFRKSYYSHSDKHYPASTKNNDHHYNRNSLTDNGNGHNGDTRNDGSSEYQNDKQDSIKLNEDEYTRISTPRSEVLFKKGYLMRAKKYADSKMPATISSTPTITTNPPTSSNDSGSVSVVSNEETASYYSIQSMSPENSSFVNGNNCNDGTSISYPNNDGYNGDVPLIFSSGFYDNNGYFYVNPYVPGHFDRFNGPIGLIPFDNSTLSNGPCSNSPAVTTDTKSIDVDHLNDFNKQHSINSEDISTSSLSENTSINNDSATPQSPLTPPLPLSPSDLISSDDTNTDCGENIQDADTSVDASAPKLTPPASVTTENEETLTEMNNNNEADTKPTENTPNQTNATNVDDPSEETIISDSYSIPYYSPFFFVPPIPFVSGGHMPYQRRNRFHRRYSYHRYNHFRKYNRFCQYNDKFYVPTNWSEAPDETTVNVVQEDSSATDDAEQASDEEKSNDIIATPTLAQCDIILKTSKLNSNVSEFVPQNKRNAAILVAETVPSSQLNVNVPEFLPKNYKPLAQSQLNGGDVNGDGSNCVEIANDESDLVAEPKEKNPANDSQHEQVQRSITNCATSASEGGVENNNNNDNINNKPSTVRTLSDLLKTNSDTKALITNGNSFVNRTELNISDNRSSSSSTTTITTTNKQQNSRIHLKADLGNKHRNKIWYNRNSSADNKNIYNTNNDLIINTNRNNNYYDKTMNNNNNNNKITKSAYPEINGRYQHHVKITDVNYIGSNSSNTATTTPMKVFNRNDMKSFVSNDGFSYAQMVVPTKSESIQSANSGTPTKLKLAKNITNVSNGKMNSKTATKTEESPSIETKQSNNCQVEWFTVGAKGKKQAHFVPFTMNLLQKNTTKEEQVNSVAEELQLDIKNDSDLVMDIMDSLALSETKPTKVHALNQAGQKKKLAVVKTSKKKSPKDKVIKESKRSRSQTFEIIEPNFENESNRTAHSADDVQAKDAEENEAKDKNAGTNYDNSEEFTFNPNVFTAPLNLKADLAKEKVPNSCTALRMSANKSIRSLMNSFDIYQPDFNITVANQQLQQAEEMVNKVLESLKKTETIEDECVTSNETNPPPEPSNFIEQIQSNDDITYDDDDDDDDGTDDADSSHSSTSSIHFEVNAKPYQNAYSSNHFLGHSFGDKNDKRDPVVQSAILSSSDQNISTNVNAEQSNDFNVSNSNFTPKEVVVQNDENSNSECDIDANAVSSVESSTLALDNGSDHKRSLGSASEPKPNVNESEPKIEFHSESFTQTNIVNHESAYSIDSHSQNNDVKEEHVVAIIQTSNVEQTESVVEQQKILSIDLMVNKNEFIQNEPKTETKSNHQIPNKQQRPWLCIVDTQMLEKQKKMQNTFPITTAVSMWLNQAQKEKTPEPILRLPNDLHGFFGTQRTKTISQTSQNTATSVGTDQYYHADNYSSDETASLTSEKDKLDLASIVDDNEEEDIMNVWELDSSPSMPTPQTPPAYQSVYGNSINYEKLLLNKNELLCSNIIDFEHLDVTAAATDAKTSATINKPGSQTKLGIDETYSKPSPEVCCSIM